VRKPASIPPEVLLDSTGYRYCFRPAFIVGTIRREVTDRMLLLGRRHTLWVMRRFERHYNEGRPHRGLELRPPAQVANGARLPDASAPVPKIRRKDVLGGLIHEYEAVAA